ncbi:hypothetical protein BEWA_011090 [Theileria equi strain WA]|uniref:Uncharacterized protein n=1 Tax=Theileria equi strain WA TaxID=1537102 RepID=L0B389_THEEQ|nr:hypothetical protein BEWA_011090 [Theileria equi strain WA]AFZ81691.1 hypothetical protein BEWA_011090 [Theileria equi strain WA]|eukprot:XP_004831357.1 hypothetical protein BEWA_011090 [Theileria equi strain WA]
MSQLYIKRSRILCSQSIESQSSPIRDLFDHDDEPVENNSDFNVECVFNSAGFLKLLLTSINPSQSDLMIQSMMSGQSMYTCISISKNRFIKYSFGCEDETQMNQSVDVVLSLQAILICINMYSQNNEVSMSYNTNDRHVILKGKCTNYDKYKHSSEIEQYLVCRLKTIHTSPLNMPFEDFDFDINKYDYFTIAARGNSTIAVEWDFSFDKNIFDEFNITKPHSYTYGTKCLQCVSNGLKLSQKIKIMIKDNGALLIKTYMTGNMSEEVQVYYYIYPFVDTET